MKHFFIAFLLATLAACSSGGSGGGTIPTPNPTATPTSKPTAYSAFINFAGGNGSLKKAMVFSFSKRIRLDSGGVAPAVIVMTSRDLDPAGWQPNWINGAGALGSDTGTASIVVSPQPSATPSEASWAIGTTGVSFNAETNVTTAVGPTPAVNAIAMRLQTTGTVSASENIQGQVVNATTSTIIYDRLSFACTNVDPSVYGTSSIEAEGGSQMVNGVATPTTDVTKADIYLSGSQCFGGFNNSAETIVTIHCPYGCVRVDDPTLFLATTTLLFVNPVTSFPTVSNPNDINELGFVIFKDAEGNLYKAAPGEGDFQNGIDQPESGPYCQLGHCPDGT